MCALGTWSGVGLHHLTYRYCRVNVYHYFSVHCMQLKCFCSLWNYHDIGTYKHCKVELINSCFIVAIKMFGYNINRPIRMTWILIPYSRIFGGVNVWRIAKLKVIGEWIDFGYQDTIYQLKFGWLKFGESRTTCQIHQTFLPYSNFRKPINDIGN